MIALMTGHLINGFPGQPSAGIDGASGKTLLLSQLKDGGEVYCDTTGVKKILVGGGVVSPVDRSVIVTTSESDNSWKLTSHGAALYLTGYIVQASDNSLAGGPVTIYTEDDPIDDSGRDSEPITIPLKGVSAAVDSVSKGDEWSRLNLNNVHPDAHLHDD